MNKLILTSLLLCAASYYSLASADPVAQQLMVAAERQVDLFSSAASPFQLEVDFVAQVAVPTKGHISLRWESSERWWSKTTLGDFEQVEIKNGEKLYTSRNASFEPLRITQVLNLLHIAYKGDHLELKKQKQQVEQGTTITCLHARLPEKRDADHDFCVNPATSEILSDERKQDPDGIVRNDYSNYAPFGGIRYPRKLELYENGIKSITAEVISLTTVPLSESFLVPPKGAIERRQCAGMKHATPVKTPDPLYPKSASENRMMGDTTVAMTVFADGSVGDIYVVGSGGRSMDEATLKTLSGWKFKPAVCGTDPVVSDIKVVVSFRLE